MFKKYIKFKMIKDYDIINKIYCIFNVLNVIKFYLKIINF